jgi:hypothetical protein
MRVDWIPCYLTNCFLLIIPIVVFNLFFMRRLPGAYQPEIFERDIPKPIVFGENTFRIVVLLMPLFMPLRVQTNIQETGVLLYLMGIVVYFASWLVVLVKSNGEPDLSQILVVAREPSNTTMFDRAARDAACHCRYRAVGYRANAIEGWYFIKIPFMIRPDRNMAGGGHE